MVRIMGWDRLIEYLGEIWEGEGGLEKLGLAVREGWEVERGQGDYYERIEGYCLTDEQGERVCRQRQMSLPSDGGWGEEVLARGRRAREG